MKKHNSIPKNVLEIKPYMRIAIDEAWEMDNNGCYQINVGYLRVSTDRQADLGYGLDIQENAVVTYAKNAGYKNLILFIDDGYTGTNMDRPAIRGIISLIQDFNEGNSKVHVAALVVPKIDRLGRTLLGTLQFIQDYIVAQKDSKSEINRNREDIDFVSVAESVIQISKNNPQGKFLFMLFATLAEYDRDLIVNKLRDGRRARVASGKWLGGGNTPYGYQYDKSLGKLIVIPEEAEKIRELFRLYIEEKLSPQNIADRLGFSGDRVVTQILRRKSLTGCILFNGEEFQGEHEAIIPLERWQEAQDELERRSVAHAPSEYLLSGLLVCGECGAKMRYQKWGTNGPKLVCYSHQSSKPSLVRMENCPNELYWASDIENAVVKSLFQMSYLGDETQKKTGSDDVIQVIMLQLKQYKAQLMKYYKRSERIDAGESDELPDVIEEQIQELSRSIRSLEQQLTNEEERRRITKKVDRAKGILRNLESTWPHMTAIEQQTVCRELIDSVVVKKNGEIDLHLRLKSFLKKQQP